MTIFWVIVLTIVPMGLGAWIGYRLINRDTLIWLCGKSVSLVILTYVVKCGLRAGWHWPLGLITPFAAGLLVALLADSVQRRLAKCWLAGAGWRLVRVG